jgi:hypothetical protein
MVAGVGGTDAQNSPAHFGGFLLDITGFGAPQEK